MPRRKITLTINELIAELHRRQQQLPRLQKLAADLEKKLAGIRAEIAALGGDVSAPATAAKPGIKPGRKPGAKAPAAPAAKKPASRPRNKMSLAEVLVSVLDKSHPKTVKTIMADVKAAGYKTTSENFDTIIYQTLSREKKRVEKVGRGLYKLKS